MKVINVSLISIEVINFLPKELSLELLVSFYDGKKRGIRFRILQIDSEKTTIEILSKIRKYEHNIHQNREGETVLDSIVSVNIANYGETFERLYKFISRISEKVEQLKSRNSEGYISTILSINSMRVDF